MGTFSALYFCNVQLSSVWFATVFVHGVESKLNFCEEKKKKQPLLSIHFHVSHERTGKRRRNKKVFCLNIEPFCLKGEQVCLH